MGWESLCYEGYVCDLHSCSSVPDTVRSITATLANATEEAASLKAKEVHLVTQTIDSIVGADDLVLDQRSAGYILKAVCNLLRVDLATLVASELLYGASSRYGGLFYYICNSHCMGHRAVVVVGLIHTPDSKVHGAYLGPTGPRWAPCWPQEPCYQGQFGDRTATFQVTVWSVEQVEKNWSAQYHLLYTASSS